MLGLLPIARGPAPAEFGIGQRAHGVANMEQPGGTALGRERELASIDGWLAAFAVASAPAMLVIGGEPGIGKTTLWTEAVRRARALGHRVLSSRPSSSDAGLPHVALTDLLRSVPDEELEPLPVPQRRALEGALLRAEPGESELDPRAVGTALTAEFSGFLRG